MKTNFIKIVVTAVSATGISRDEFIENVAKEILTKIPPEYDMIKVKRNFGLGVTPSAVVLFQELDRFNKLIRRMTTTLSQLRKVPTIIVMKFAEFLLFLLLLLFLCPSLFLSILFFFFKFR